MHLVAACVAVAGGGPHTCVAQTCEMTCAQRVRSCRSSAAAAAAAVTPFDNAAAFVYDPGSEWQDRALCASRGITAAARAVNLSFNAIGVAIDRHTHPAVARDLLRTGPQKDCSAGELVLKRLEAKFRLQHAQRDPWLHHLFTHGYSRIDRSWGLASILRQGLATQLRDRLDAQETMHAREVAGGGELGNQSGVKVIHADVGEAQQMMRKLTSVLMDRLQPMAAAYLGADVGPGRLKLLLLEGKPIAPLWYSSGLYHHDRCGPRLKCFVNLLNRVGPEAHPMLLVPRTHTTV